MKKLLFPLMAAFAIMANTVTYASEQVLTNSDAAALMAKAKEGGVSPSQISGALSKMKGYKPKDAIYIPSGGLYLFQDERSQLMAVTTDGRYSLTGGSLVDVIKRKPVLTVEEM